MEGFELSPQQKQLWQLQATAPHSPYQTPYRAQCTIQITGKVEAPLLKLAIEKVISNHEILRTTFKSVAGMRFPFQVISPDAHFKFEQYDYTRVERSEQSSKIDLLWAQCDQFPLDFSENSLFQCIWIALSETKSLLLLNLPALYADTQGLDNLARIILNTYSATFPQDSATPEDILQYVDISEWQNQLLQDNEEDLIFSKAYWREQKIANGLSLQLPLEQQPNQKVAFEPRHCELTLPSSQVKKISTFLQQQNVSLNLFFLTCWQVLLWRITQQSDLVVGVGSDLRQYEELQNTIGLLAKQLPLKCHFTKGLSFLEALKNTENALKDAYRWQERFSWDFITDAQQNETKAPFAPFGFEFTSLKPHLLEGIGFELIEHKVYCDQFKVKFNITHSQSASSDKLSEKLAAQLSYDASLLSEDYIQCLAEQLQTLISNTVTHPEISIEKIELISAAKRETILHQFNHTACDYPKDKCIHQLFEAQAQKTLDAVAVAFEDEHLTYQQLNTKANQLAHYLQSMGVGAEVLVGIFVERSLDMLVGLLGILKAGGAYVPLDPSYPAERLSHMLSDSQLPFLLTQQHLRLKIPKTQAQIICLDENNPDLSNYSSANPNSDVQPDNLAYIIYTSGSTGKPKGTMIIHQGLVNYLSWAVDAYKVAEGAGSTVNSSIGFDATITSLFSPLLVGGKVVLLPQEGEIEALKAALSSDTDYSLVKITPAHLEILSTLFAKETVDIKTRAFIIGGEALSEKVASFWQRYAPNTRLINEYGPTETVVGCCTYAVSKQDVGKKNIPIGHPIANTQLYILDEQLHPLPIGVAGELYIGGEGVARGYLHRPELTAERFITIPAIAPIGRGRLYKTGDLARYLPDGTIEYLGRIDNQVKIRGFRIELGEIEAVLTAHAQIQQAVVVAREEKAGNKYLVGYVVAAEGLPLSEQLTPKQLRDSLKSSLPNYMVPSAFVTLETLPLTPNGKVDRKALPAPNQEIAREHQYIAPRNPVEEVIADIFASVLNVQNIGVCDNFFELGGHSLLAFRLMSELQQKFQINLPLATLFQSPTIEQLARVIDADSAHKLWSPLVPLQQQGELTPLFLIGGAGGTVFYLQALAQELAKDLSGELGKERPLYGLQAQGLDGITLPLQSIPAIATQYIEAIRTLQPNGPYLLAGHSFGGRVAFEMGRQLEEMGESVAFVGILDTLAPLSEANLEQSDYDQWDHATWLFRIAEIIEEMLEEKIEVSYETLAFLTEEKQFNYFQDALEKVGFLPSKSDIKLVRGLVEVYKTQCLIQYLPEQTSSVPITLFCAQEISTKQKSALPLLQNPTWGWEKFSNQAVEVRSVSGNHISMLRPPHVKGLAAALNQSLLKIESSSSQTLCQTLPA